MGPAGVMTEGIAKVCAIGSAASDGTAGSPCPVTPLGRLGGITYFGVTFSDISSSGQRAQIARYIIKSLLINWMQNSVAESIGQGKGTEHPRFYAYNLH
jgi:hypothetical protein